MPVLVTCSECGGPIPPDAPEGICPACLWRLVDVPDLAAGGRAAGRTVIDAAEDASDAPVSVSTTVSLDTTVDYIRPAPNAPAAAGLGSDEPDQSGGGAVRRLGNYDLVEELGRGGMGVVFKAVQRLAGRTVAVKRILGGVASGAEQRRRFLSEVQVLARLRHPHIVPIYEVSEEDGCPYFSMEYVAGGTLSDRIRREPVPASAAARIVEQLAAAVHAAHGAGVLHRDIKPGNVLLDADGTPKLTDFGLAKQLDSGDGPTHTGSVIGTPAYMSPEQAGGTRELTPAADVYSLGATLYALLTGRPPFVGRDLPQTIARVMNDEPRPPRAVRREIPRDLEAVCLKCLEKDPSRRYATAQALADDLARWREGASTVARPQTLPQRAWRQVRRHRRVSTVAIMLVTIGLATAAVVRWRDPLWAIDAAIARGEKVALIDEKGITRWHQLVVGAGTIDLQSADAFDVQAVGAAYLEFAARVPQQKFRISVEFRTQESTRHSGSAGIYLARVPGEKTATQSAQRVMTFQMFDDVTSEPVARPNGDPLSIQDNAIVTSVAKGLDVRGMPVGKAEIPRSPKQDNPYLRPWHRLVVEVDSVEIRAALTRDVGEEPSVVRTASIFRKNLERLTTDKQEWLASEYPALAATPLHFDPSGGCGLFLRDARVQFRRLTIEPIP